MKTFLKNNSKAAVDNGNQAMTTAEFKTSVEAVVNQYGLPAVLFRPPGLMPREKTNVTGFCMTAEIWTGTWSR